MARASRTTLIKTLFSFIYGLKDKCDSINDVNKNLITQYCRFTVISDEVSLEIEQNLGKISPEEMESLIDLYEKFNKITLNLYKALKFDTIKDELKSEKNPYLALLESNQDDDF